ncbi:DUF5681 domain-containing protein [Oceanisphaera pacifica]|uniref:DUF5681 domain-containing protein n=1 Tax=Oceanisphaera pacifica TaxID=2818389 RepID=A0ABS3NJ79_9GAMM|nr:DUF5681 domain-containing protein [Oceanisphaera pacifica]MBO1520639.1 hypothetical protein [Oceanisphaera pacifica]
MSKFKAGKSGNPAGRPKGIPDSRSALRRELEKHGEELLNTVVKMALEGDASALKLCLERIMPPVKPSAEPVTFELSGDTLTEQAQSILKAIAQGELDPITGRQLLAAIADLSKITEIDELSRRLDELEERTA